LRQRIRYTMSFLTDAECREVLKRVLDETAHPALVETHVIDVAAQREEEL